MVWSNLALQWINEPQRAFAEMHRVLAPGGLLLFSSFGPDTLKELRAAFQGVDRHTHVHRFIDMHDVGDMLVACGFADPVMDMEVVTLTYADVRELMRDLKAIGAHNVTRGRPPGSSASRCSPTVARNYEAFAPRRQAPRDLRGGLRPRLEAAAAHEPHRPPGHRHQAAMRRHEV